MNDDMIERITEKAAGTSFERHAQTALTLLVVALLCWVALTTQQLDVKVEVMASQFENFKEQTQGPNARVDDLVRRVEIIEKTVLERQVEQSGE